MAKLLSWDGVNTKYIEHIKTKKYKQVPDVKDRDKEIIKIPHEEIKNIFDVPAVSVPESKNENDTPTVE